MSGKKLGGFDAREIYLTLSENLKRRSAVVTANRLFYPDWAVKNRGSYGKRRGGLPQLGACDSHMICFDDSLAGEVDTM